MKISKIMKSLLSLLLYTQSIQCFDTSSITVKNELSEVLII